MDFSAFDLLLRLFWACALVGLGWLVGAWATGAANGELARWALPPNLRVGLVRALLPAAVVLAALGAVPLIGLDTRPFLVLLALAGLPLALGARTVAGGLLAGIALRWEGALPPGTRIRHGETEGTLGAIGLLSAEIEMADGARVRIPNAALLEGPTERRPPGPTGADPAR